MVYDRGAVRGPLSNIWYATLSPGRKGDDGKRQQSGSPATDDLNTLIYVDRQLIVPVAARLVGSSVSAGKNVDVRGGLSWMVAASTGYSEEIATEVQIADLFPEDVFWFAYDQIVTRQLRVSEFCDKISRREVVVPATVSVFGTLELEGEVPTSYNPFDPPSFEPPGYYDVGGVRCFLGKIVAADGFAVPVYFREEAASQVYYAHKKPVEIVGVVKWAPTYEVGGYSINAVLLDVAVLLAR